MLVLSPSESGTPADSSRDREGKYAHLRMSLKTKKDRLAFRQAYMND